MIVLNNDADALRSLIVFYSTATDDSRLVPSPPSISNVHALKIKMPKAGRKKGGPSYLAIEAAIKQAIDAEIAHRRVGNALSYEEARAQILDMKKTRQLSYKKMIDGNVKSSKPGGCLFSLPLQ
jgi:hypothetical protein